MHYYSHNIADYRKDTSHLTLLEHGIYRQLLDTYYLDELPLCADTAKLMRSHSVRTSDEQEAFKNVLMDFFELTENGYIHKRCDEVISQYHGKSSKARASAMARWANKINGDDANALQTQSKGNANHKPITNNQEPITNIKPLKSIKVDSQASLSKSAISTQCPQKEILKLWKTKLPNLAQPRSWEGHRQVNLKNRWLQASKASDYSPDGYQTEADGLRWWESFFDYIAKDTKLAQGFESNNRTWKPDLEWVVNASNFQKIIDGKYDK